MYKNKGTIKYLFIVLRELRFIICLILKLILLFIKRVPESIFAQHFSTRLTCITTKFGILNPRDLVYKMNARTKFSNPIDQCHEPIYRFHFKNLKIIKLSTKTVGIEE